MVTVVLPAATPLIVIFPLEIDAVAILVFALTTVYGVAPPLTATTHSCPTLILTEVLSTTIPLSTMTLKLFDAFLESVTVTVAFPVAIPLTVIFDLFTVYLSNIFVA